MISTKYDEALVWFFPARPFTAACDRAALLFKELDIGRPENQCLGCPDSSLSALGQLRAARSVGLSVFLLIILQPVTYYSLAGPQIMSFHSTLFFITLMRGCRNSILVSISELMIKFCYMLFHLKSQDLSRRYMGIFTWRLYRAVVFKLQRALESSKWPCSSRSLGLPQGP